MLLTSKEQEVAFNIRKVMYNDNSADTVTEKLIALMSKTRSNIEFLDMFTKLDVLNKDNGKEKWER